MTRRRAQSGPRISLHVRSSVDPVLPMNRWSDRSVGLPSFDVSVSFAICLFSPSTDPPSVCPESRFLGLPYAERSEMML